MLVCYWSLANNKSLMIGLALCGKLSVFCLELGIFVYVFRGCGYLTFFYINVKNIKYFWGNKEKFDNN